MSEKGEVGLIVVIVICVIGFIVSLTGLIVVETGDGKGAPSIVELHDGDAEIRVDAGLIGDGNGCIDWRLKSNATWEISVYIEGLSDWDVDVVGVGDGEICYDSIGRDVNYIEIEIEKNGISETQLIDNPSAGYIILWVSLSGLFFIVGLVILLIWAMVYVDV